MAKASVGSRIGENYLEIIENIHNKIGGNKYRIYEASIDLFNAIPTILQMALVSYDNEQRQQILDIIAQLTPPPQPKKGSKKR